MKKHTNRTTTTLMLALFAASLLALAAPPARAAAPPDDTEIADTLEDEFARDGVVPVERINVAVEDGVVTLSGTASNLPAKERATRIAETIKGVISVVNTIGVDPREPVDDAAISENVRVALIADPAVEKSGLDIKVSDGTVTLGGTVNSWQEKELAVKVAKAIKGVRSVVSNIDVDYEEDRPDAELQNEVRRALKWNALVDDGLIVVRVRNAKVTLTGTVGSAAEKTEAITSAWVAGVEKVDASALEVSPHGRDESMRKDTYAPRMDAEIQGAVKRALASAPRVPAGEVDVDVDEAEVTLRGRVDTVKAKRAAARAARNTVGVLKVNNRVRVRPDLEEEPPGLAKRVEEALARNAYVEPYDIRVRVEGGVANLYGSVDSRFEKVHADEVAAGVAGVTEVDNHLHVPGDAGEAVESGG